MNRRTYDPDRQAELSRRIRSSKRPEWEEFGRLWMAFNALYITVEAGSEVDKVRRSTALLSEEATLAILKDVDDARESLAALPPGDMRLSASSPRFRDSARADLETAADPRTDAHRRLGALLAVVYQVRCNLLHGAKDPDRDRDLMLVRLSNDILATVVLRLETALQNSG